MTTPSTKDEIVDHIGRLIRFGSPRVSFTASIEIAEKIYQYTREQHFQEAKEAIKQTDDCRLDELYCCTGDDGLHASDCDCEGVTLREVVITNVRAAIRASGEDG